MMTKYVFAKSIDRGGPGMAPDWPQADPALNRFYLVADVEQAFSPFLEQFVKNTERWNLQYDQARQLLARLKGHP